MDSSSKATTMVVSDPVVDPVESLRAAALSTLKAKRRKPAASAVPQKKVKPTPPKQSRAPPSADAMQLDYGLEEDKAAPTAPMAVDAIPPNDVAKDVHGDEQSQPREEGEISEEEEPPPPPRQSMTLSPIPGRKVSGTPSLGAASAAELQKLNIEEAPAQSDSVCAPMTPPQTQSAPMESILETPDHLALAREEAEIADSLMMDDSDCSQNAPSVVLLDIDHVRPGLRITQQEHDTIKSLILDLLGWGVTVETMLKSGVNRQVIYYVFNELNLRLPDNFDVSGILPYTPEIFSQPHSHPVASMGTPSPIRMNGHGPVRHSHAELDLHDRERQRRQELVARKAARVASQQAKPVIKTEAADPTFSFGAHDDNREDVVMGPAAVPAETVDDFLASLGPVEELRSAASSSSREASAPQSAAEIDPDLENGQVIEYTPHSANLSEFTTPIGSGSSGSFRFSEPPPSSSEPPPTSVDSASTTYSRMSGMSNEDLISPSTAQIIPPKMVRASIRRPTNRPVASDFVDFHGESSRLPPSATNLDNRNGRPAGASITRPLRKHTSFSKVGNARRCVIDLSDSEDDHAANNGQPRVPMPTLADQRRDSSRQVWNGKFALPTVSKPATPSISPAILEQKELEIKKMREMIAQREEETRQKKLAMAKAATGSDSIPRSITPTQPLVPKQEEPEVVSMPPAVETEVTMEVDNVPDVPPSPSSVASTPPATRNELPHEESSSVITKQDQEQLALQTNEDVAPATEENSISSQSDVPPHDTPGIPQVADLTQTQTQTSSNDLQKSAVPHSPPVEKSVDADVSMSSSTQMNGNPTTPPLPAPQQILQKQDARSPLFLSSTLKNEPDTQFDKFSSYHSPFESYPGLFHRPERTLDSSLFSRDSSLFISSSEPSSLPFYSDLHSSGPESFLSSAITVPKSRVPLLDLKPLKVLASAKLFNPASRICQFEIPGGGVCRDSKCTDIHLSRFAGMDGKVEVKPSDHDTAQYLFDTLPHSWLTASGIASPGVILQALQQIDQEASGVFLSFDDRVTRALLSFKPRPMT